ncbi:glycosyltransferase family 87 protein [Virgisporangium aliadipatigenens]|uniref:glycosyltransferase family 87 protein n=1 Tax=Virgisporangium aliadipatigenens TaxID=741659 RepID=UPI001941A332|nr:glycosyltransferase 87 family protein [Virgisporangium aliadipatigenens]
MTTAASVDQPEPDSAPPAGAPLALRSPVDEPARSDGFVRGLSEAIGGPLGDYASRAGRTTFGGQRFWSVGRIVLAMICLTLSLHWVQKYPCNDGAWADLKQYKYMCYTDVLALYYAERLSDGAVPYRDHPVEYPVVTGAFMGVIGLGVHALGQDNPDLNQGQLFYNLNALALGALGVATAGLLLSVRKRRPWDVALFALSPALFLSATVNWDLLAIAFAAAGFVLWAKRYPAWAGVMIGLGASAKLWPALLAFPLLALCVRAGKLKEFGIAMGAGAAAIAAVNVPVALLWRDNWMRFIDLNRERPIDWGTLWYIGDHFPRGGDQYGLEPFQWLGRNIPVLNTLTWVLIGASMVAIGALILTAPRRPRLAQVAFLAVAAFLIFNKVWSQQFVLWLIPLIVLARPRWGAFLAWSFAEVAYFVAFYGQLMGASGKTVFPEWVFVLAATLRLGTVILLVVLVVREIRYPELDVVRQSYADDPDGGVLDEAPDRRDVKATSAAPEPVPA